MRRTPTEVSWRKLAQPAHKEDPLRDCKVTSKYEIDFVSWHPATKLHARRCGHNTNDEFVDFQVTTKWKAASCLGHFCEKKNMTEAAQALYFQKNSLTRWSRRFWSSARALECEGSSEHGQVHRSLSNCVLVAHYQVWSHAALCQRYNIGKIFYFCYVHTDPKMERSKCIGCASKILGARRQRSV